MSEPAPRPETFAPALLAWFERHGRHDLPWQQDRTPYRVWVSEIMLQQTQVATVIPYFARFMASFPDVRALADAPLDDVLHHWSGLGYYARARNLHRAAQRIRDEHGGEFPRTLDEVIALPGIGRSTAGAILAQSRGERHAILDGNVKRVLARWFGIEGFPGEARVEAELWRRSESVTPAERAADYTQAVMDLGATLCTRTKPACALCPVMDACVARRTGRTHLLPTPRPARARPRRAVTWLVVRSRESVLLERRPPAGLWGGLWGFPEFASVEDAAAFARERFAIEALQPWSTIEHAFTHFDLDIAPLIGDLRARACVTGADDERASAVAADALHSAAVMEADRWAWYNVRAQVRLGLAAPVAELIAAVLDQESSCPAQ